MNLLKFLMEKRLHGTIVVYGWDNDLIPDIFRLNSENGETIIIDTQVDRKNIIPLIGKPVIVIGNLSTSHEGIKIINPRKILVDFEYPSFPTSGSNHQVCTYKFNFLSANQYLLKNVSA